MKLWKTETARAIDLEQTLNKLELDDWEVFAVLQGVDGVTVVARREASRWEIEETANAPTWADEARALLAQGKKIQAIKHVRAVTGWGLKEAKEYVEREL